MKPWILLQLIVFASSPMAYAGDSGKSMSPGGSGDPETEVEQAVESTPLPPELLETLASKRDKTKTGNADPYYRNQVLRKSPGKVLSAGTNLTPAGNLKVKTYRLEEITTPEAWEIKVAGENQVVNKAWRLTLVGGPFPIGALPIVVWVDDKIMAFGDPVEEGLVAVTFDSTVLVDGATISVSYGEKGIKTKLPEKLSLKGAF